MLVEVGFDEEAFVVETFVGRGDLSARSFLSREVVELRRLES